MGSKKNRGNNNANTPESTDSAEDLGQDTNIDETSDTSPESGVEGNGAQDDSNNEADASGAGAGSDDNAGRAVLDGVDDSDDGQGLNDEGDSDVGGTGSESGVENADGELASDLRADQGTNSEVVEPAPEKPTLGDILTPEEQDALKDATVDKGEGDAPNPETPVDPASQVDEQDGEGKASGGTEEPNDPVDQGSEVPNDAAPVSQEPAQVNQASDAPLTQTGPKDQANGEVVAPQEQPEPEPEPAPEPTPENKPEEAEAPAEAAQEPAAEEQDPTQLSLKQYREKYKGVLEADTLAALDVSAFILYEEKNILPNKTTRGEFPVDVRRTRDMATWTDAALLDWIGGQIKTPRGVTEEALHDELYRRYKIPGNWTEAAAAKYLATGEKPAYTDSGVLVEDRARNASPLNHWTFKEIKAALLGEIDKLEHKAEDLVDVFRQRMGLSSATSQDKIMESLKDSPNEVDMSNTVLEAKLGEYKAAMSKANLSTGTAGAAQTILYRVIREVMARDPQPFHEGWLKLLNFVNTEYATLFTPEKARRGWAQINIPSAALRTFEDVLTLLINTRAPATRVQEASIHNLENILKNVPEKDRQNVIQFYQPAF